jgi:hypothetical protein
MTKKRIEGDKKNRPMVELIANAGETATDLFVSNPALKELPVVDWAFKIIKAFDGFRSWLLARKIEKFLSEPSLIKAAEASKMRERVMVDENYAQDVGETLLMVLDKVTDFSKPVLLAKCYAAFLDDEIDQYALAMLVHVIDISAIRDLEQFIQQYVENPSEHQSEDTLWRARLASSGLFSVYFSGALGGGGGGYDLAPLGATLIEVLKYTGQQAFD